MIARIEHYPTMKSSGVEWLGEVPEHWEVQRLGSSASVLNGATPSTNIEKYWNGDLLWLTPEDLGQLQAQRINSSARKITLEGHASCGTSIAPANSVALSTRAPIGHLGILATAGCANQGCKLLVPDASIDTYYLFRILKAARSELQSLGQGTTFQELSRARLRNFQLPIPPIEEQTAIACFLEYATNQIERYIRAKEKLIALLEELKRVMIHDAVTGRIDVRTGKPYPAYKPSGIEWLGDVPIHWKVSRAKRVFWPRTEYARPDDIQLSATQAYGVIAQQKYEERIGRKVTKVLRHLDKRRHVEVDDFVISMRSFQGGLERAWESGCIRSSYIVLRPVTKLSVDYYSHLFKSIGYIAALQLTANFIRDGQDLNFSNFCQVDLPFPPRSEQKEISDALNNAIANIVSSIDRANREIELLREYRTRLIADVVTGKLDVREVAASLPDLESIADGGDEEIPTESDSQQSSTTLHNEAPPTTPGASS